MGMRYRIREFRKKKGLSQEELGALLGRHWQTVQRAEAGKTTLSDDKLREYADALGVDPHMLLDAGNGFRHVVVKGYVQAGHWAETWEWPEEDQYAIPVLADPDLERYALHAAEVRGPSMNRVYEEGTVIIFTDMIQTREDLVLGKRYVVERERPDGLREGTVKTLWRDPEGRYWLKPESDDPRFGEAIPIDGDEGDVIRIVGRVRGSYRRE